MPPAEIRRRVVERRIVRPAGESDPQFPMPILTCPRCGNSGEIRGDDGCFEDVWPGARGHLPVRKCSECGAGIILSTKFLALGMRATVIPDDIWVRMGEENFGRPVAASATRRRGSRARRPR